MMSPLIYVADDEVMLLELAESVLRSQGYAVRTFQVPEDALSAFLTAKPKPDLLLTDYAMGTMNGLELIEKCVAAEPNLKTIMVSGTVSKDIMNGAAVKADDFLSKPYRVDDLIRSVHGLLS